MRIIRKTALSVLAVAALIGGTAAAATSASAATSTTAARTAPAACGWTNPLGTQSYGGEVKFWLNYDTCNRTVRGAAAVQVANGVDWHLWVWNEDTNVTKGLDINSDYPPQADSTQYTVATSDAGTESHVCIMPYDLSGDPEGSKSCTSYY